MSNFKAAEQEPLRYVNPLANSEVKDLPWPYNLLAILNSEYTNMAEPINYEISPKHLQFIEKIVSSHLRQRYSDCLFGFFRDHLTMEQVGERVGVSRNRADQCIHKALRDLWRPVILEKILYGPEVTFRQDALQKRLSELDAREAAADRREEALTKREELLRQQELNLAQRVGALKVQYLAHGLTPPEIFEVLEAEDESQEIYDTSVDHLDLSVREYNCVTRAGCRTLGDIVDIARRGELRRIRNLGDGTARRILARIWRLTSEDLFEVNQVTKPSDL